MRRSIIVIYSVLSFVVVIIVYVKFIFRVAANPIKFNLIYAAREACDFD